MVYLTKKKKQYWMDSLTDSQTYTFSALADILSDSFALTRTEEFPGCGNYYYNEIKCAKWENRAIRVLEKNLDVLNGKIDNLDHLQRRNLITKALKEFAFRNIPDNDTEMLCKHMEWLIV